MVHRQSSCTPFFKQLNCEFCKFLTISDETTNFSENSYETSLKDIGHLMESRYLHTNIHPCKRGGFPPIWPPTFESVK